MKSVLTESATDEEKRW